MGVPDRLGDFRIVGEIGRGGFGVVYRAHQLSLDRPVAVKVLFRHLIHTEDQVSRFEREARAAARLDHPAIVSVYAWGEEGDDFYIAQRLVGSGRTLADELDELRRSGSPPKGYFREVARRLARVADGLEQAHERGIVHRDVKPSNVLLDEHGLPYLGDFGLAKIEDGLELSRTGDFAGSPYYMSPEQADGRRGPIDHRTDVYSLGVTLYELLTLQHAFTANSSPEVIRKILNEEPRRPSRVEPRVPQDLETICLHAMEKDPSRRYQSAHEMAADLRAFLEGEPIRAIPIGTARRLLRAVRRHHQPMTVAMLAAIVVLGGLWAGGALRSSRRDATRSETAAGIQSQRAEELGQVADEFSRKIQDAAQSGNPGAVQQLAEEQRQITQMLDENYRWLLGQVEGLGDTEALVQVGGGIAAGGVVGGLQSYAQLLVSQKAAAGQETLAAEANRRLRQVFDALGSIELDEGARTPEGASPAERRAELERYHLWFVLGRLFAVPRDLPEAEGGVEPGDQEATAEPP
jgi:hypothetical protein